MRRMEPISGRSRRIRMVSQMTDGRDAMTSRKRARDPIVKTYLSIFSVRHLWDVFFFVYEATRSHLGRGISSSFWPSQIQSALGGRTWNLHHCRTDHSPLAINLNLDIDSESHALALCFHLSSCHESCRSVVMARRMRNRRFRLPASQVG